MSRQIPLVPLLALAFAALLPPFTAMAAAPSPDAVVVFNEVHYNPLGQAEDGEWLELFNQMGIMVDLSGWRIDGLGFVFPAGTLLDPGGYLVVAKSPVGGQIGPFTGSLDNSGERLRLINQGGRLMDELDYGDDARWPAAADGSGVTLAKRAPYTASRPSENWSASAQVGGTPGSANFPDANAPPPTTTVPLLQVADAWRFNEAGVDLGAGWASVAHGVGGDWASGPGGHGSETGATIPLGTVLTLPAFNNPYVVAYYFEREFVLTAAQVAGLQSLKLRHGFDDGAVVYLNGAEVLRVNMPGGTVTASTLASTNVEVDVLSADVPIASAAAVAGTNRLSVEVHQSAVGNSDVVFGLELDAVLAGAVPGAAPQLVFNEIPPSGEPSFWVELANAGPVPIDLRDIRISAAADPLREYVLPGGDLAPGALAVVEMATLGFRPADGEKLFLYDAGGTVVLDARAQTGRLRGRAADRGGEWLYPAAPTPGTANPFVFHDSIVISEIAYNPPGLPATPATPATFASTRLISHGDAWRYNDADENLPAGWAASPHAVGGNWMSGPAPIGRETAALPIPLGTGWTLADYAGATITYYFEAEFTVAAPDLAGIDSLAIAHLIDDGAVFYLNGTEVGRFNMPGGAVTPETLASSSVGDAAPVTLEIPPGALVAGTNRLSVEVHQSAAGSSDVVFGAQLDARVRTGPAVEGQPFRNSNNQWLEIANRGTADVDLGGWEFFDGIGFTFPPGTILAPGEHACIARDVAGFAAAYPGARVLGAFSGSLSGSGERLDLRDAAGNPADLVRYHDGGAWPGGADGGGSTLELRDLDADNAVGGAWAASDESGRTGWKTYTYRETAGNSLGPDGQWSEFNMGLLSSGEILIDDLSVIENPDGAAVQKISNRGFDTPAGWFLLGNHRHSAIVDDPDAPGNKVLRLVATGPTEHIHNQVATTLASPAANGRAYEISFRARWVSGSNQLHTRLYFNRCANVNVIDRPANPGTPSAPNSRATPNIGPTYSGLRHEPAVPSAGQATTVSVGATDPDGVTGLTLHYSVNGGPFQSVAMGTSGGRSTGGIPGQAAAAVVQFYLSGADALGATTFFPPEGPDSRALYKVNDGTASGTGIHNFRIVMTAADVAFQHVATEVMSNDRLGATVIDREGDIYYDCGVRLKSSERGRNQLTRVGYHVRFPADGLYRGAHESVAIDRSEGQAPGQFELLFDMMMSNSGGVLSRYYDLIRVLAPNGTLTGSATLQMARYDELFLDSQFENGSDGQVYEYELIYYPTTANASGLKLPYPSPDNVIGASVSNLGDDPETYRWFFLNKINREADNFAPIMAYAKQFSKSGAAFEQGLDAVVDVDDWFRGMAYGVLSGAGDNAAAGSQHNGLYYAKPDGRVMFLPHDMDFAFDSSRSIFANGECNRLAADPVRRRIYLGHLQDIIATTYNNQYMGLWTTHFAALDPAQNWASELSYITTRSNNVLSQINGAIASVDFGITTPSPITVAGGTATVAGDGWINVREIRVRGSTQSLPVTWTDNNSWRVTVPAPPGFSDLTLEALDFAGQVIGTADITLNNTTPFEPASADNLVISEIMYHPADPTEAEIAAGITDPDQFEYLELMNIGPVLVDLTNVRFNDGIDYLFASGTTLDPGARVVVVRDRAAFLSRYSGSGATIAAGQFLDDTGLANGGESLRLLDAGGADIRNFGYGDTFPWPEAADGDGYSLVLVAPHSNPDHALAANWRSGGFPGGDPGSGDASPFTGDPSADADADGLNAFLEHALGSSDSDPGSPGLMLATDPAGLLTLSYPRNLLADDVASSLEYSGDLLEWIPAASAATPGSEIPLGDGRSLVTWIVASPAGTTGFVRLAVAAK